MGFTSAATPIVKAGTEPGQTAASTASAVRSTAPAEADRVLGPRALMGSGTVRVPPSTAALLAGMGRVQALMSPTPAATQNNLLSLTAIGAVTGNISPAPVAPAAGTVLTPAGRARQSAEMSPSSPNKVYGSCPSPFAAASSSTGKLSKIISLNGFGEMFLKDASPVPRKAMPLGA